MHRLSEFLTLQRGSSQLNFLFGPLGTGRRGKFVKEALIFDDVGLEFYFDRAGAVDRIAIHSDLGKCYSALRGDLLSGLSYAHSREAVQNLLGTPTETAPDGIWEAFPLSNGIVQIEYSGDDRVCGVNVLSPGRWQRLREEAKQARAKFRKIVRRTVRTVPQCISSFFVEPAHLRRSQGEPYQGRWRIACPCGSTFGTLIAASCVSGQEEFIGGPISMTCSECGSRNRIFDRQCHGWPAEWAKVHEKPELNPPPEVTGEFRLRCIYCQGERFRVTVVLDYRDLLFQETYPSIDLPNSFHGVTIFGQCELCRMDSILLQLLDHVANGRANQAEHAEC